MITASPRNSLRLIVEAHFAQAGIELNGAIEVDSARRNLQHGAATALGLDPAALRGADRRRPAGAACAAPGRSEDLPQVPTVAHQPQHEPSAAGELLIEFVVRSLRSSDGGTGAMLERECSPPAVVSD